MIQQIPEGEDVQFFFQQLTPLRTNTFEVFDGGGEYVVAGTDINKSLKNINTYNRWRICGWRMLILIVIASPPNTKNFKNELTWRSVAISRSIEAKTGLSECDSL